MTLPDQLLTLRAQEGAQVKLCDKDKHTDMLQRLFCQMESERQTAQKSFEDVHASNFLSGIDEATLTTQGQKATKQTSLLYLLSNNVKKSQPILFLHLCVATVGFLPCMQVFFVLATCCHLRVGLSFNGGVFTLQSTLSHPRLQTVSPSVFRSG